MLLGDGAWREHTLLVCHQSLWRAGGILAACDGNMASLRPLSGAEAFPFGVQSSLMQPEVYARVAGRRHS